MCNEYHPTVSPEIVRGQKVNCPNGAREATLGCCPPDKREFENILKIIFHLSLPVVFSVVHYILNYFTLGENHELATDKATKIALSFPGISVSVFGNAGIYDHKRLHPFWPELYALFGCLASVLPLL